MDADTDTDTDTEYATDAISKVYADYDDDRRIDIWTDGEWVKVGHDIENGKCLTLRYEHGWDYYHEMRGFKGPAETFTIKDEQGHDKEYLVRSDGHSFRVFFGRSLAFENTDHEFGALATALRYAREHRESRFDYEAIARSYAQSVLPDESMYEIASLSLNESTKNAQVEARHTYSMNRVNEAFIETITEAEFAEWRGVYHHTTDDECEGFRYHFLVNTKAIRAAEAEAEAETGTETPNQ